jgi:hypothetical protein
MNIHAENTSGHPLYGITGNTVKGDQLKRNTIGQPETKVETRVENSVTLGSSLLAPSVFGYTHDDLAIAMRD